MTLKYRHPIFQYLSSQYLHLSPIELILELLDGLDAHKA